MVNEYEQQMQSPQALEAQQRATAVVLAYRALDWEAVKAGDLAAVRALVAACELHDAARRFLAEEDVGELGEKLDRGLDRYYAESVGPRLGDPLVVLQLSQLPMGEASGSPGGGNATPSAPEEGLAPRSRPQVTVGHTIRMNTGCGHLYVTVNESEDGKPFELFNHMGKAGGCAASQNEAIGRLISYALRCGARLEPLIKQLKGISCHRPAWGEDGKISSCSDAIGKALETYHHNRQLRAERGLVGGNPDAHLQPAGNGHGRSGPGASQESAMVSGNGHGASHGNGQGNGQGNGNGHGNGHQPGTYAGPAAASGAVAPAPGGPVQAHGMAPAASLQASSRPGMSWDAQAASGRMRTSGGVAFERPGPAASAAMPARPSPPRSQDVHRVQGACVDCGSQLSFEEGCVKCHSCGFTECG